MKYPLSEKNIKVMLKLIRKRFKAGDKVKIKPHKGKILIEKIIKGGKEMKTLLITLFLLLPITCFPKWRGSGYCSCKICTGIYSDGFTASGKKVKVGMVANNWLKFGTKVIIEGLGGFIVEDRGSIAYFGTKEERRKAIDIYFDKHEEAKEFGVQYLEVEVIK